MYFDKNTNNRTWAQLSFIFRSDWWAGRILIKTIQNSGLCWGFFVYWAGFFDLSKIAELSKLN